MAYEVVNAADLPQETSTTLDGSEQLIGFDTAQGKRITVSELAEYILQKKLSSLAGSSQTVAAAFTALNSKLDFYISVTPLESTTDAFLKAMSDGIYNLFSSISRGVFCGNVMISGNDAYFVCGSIRNGALKYFAIRTTGVSYAIVRKSDGSVEYNQMNNT